MKRLIVAVALALSTAPALADTGAPFEQNELDRALPTVPETFGTYERMSSERMPFEQTELDRGELATHEPVRLASIGGSYKSEEGGESPWMSDPSFIAPAP
jgi:hypothetical protein